MFQRWRRERERREGERLERLRAGSSALLLLGGQLGVLKQLYFYLNLSATTEEAAYHSGS